MLYTLKIYLASVSFHQFITEYLNTKGSSMNKSIILLFFILIPNFLNAQQQTSEHKKELIKINRTIFEKHILQHSSKSLTVHALDNYSLINPLGKLQSKKEVINEVNTIEVSKLKVVVNEFMLHDQTAIIVGTLVLKGSFQGKPLPKKIRYMSVFVKVDDKWYLQARSLTPIKSPKKTK